jgi:hypothetical protein
MKKLNCKNILAFVLILTLFTSCTKNERVKYFGGKDEIKLKDNEILINITWKESDMWVLTLDTTTNIKYFRESSSWGVFEGEIIIK